MAQEDQTREDQEETVARVATRTADSKMEDKDVHLSSRMDLQWAWDSQ